MASEITPDGRVIVPLNITKPAPIFDLRGFQWRGVDTPQPSQDRHEQHPTDQAPMVAPLVATSHREAAVPQGAVGLGGGPPRGVPPGQMPPATPGVQEPRPEDLTQLDKQLGLKDKRSPLLPFPLEQFHGAYAGNGFSLIFVPRSDAENKVEPGTDNGPNDNTLLLHLTTEQWTFGPTLGPIPNRGLFSQPTITLGGLPYLQTVQDVTDVTTGLPTKIPSLEHPNGIHFEPGVWLHVPAADTFHTTADQKRGSIVRMASIPHGTTINTQGLVPQKNVTPDTPLGGVKGPPDFDHKSNQVDTTPFHINQFDEKVKFKSMDAKETNKLREPPNLAKFNESKDGSGRITTDIIKNPNLVLKNATKGQTILETISFEVHSGHPVDKLNTAKLNGGGTANISFLHGKQTPEITTTAPGAVDMPNAHGQSMTNKWWIETVLYDVIVQPRGGNETVILRPTMPVGSTAPTPEFAITTPPGGVKKETTIKVPGTQLQYSQTVNLNFGPDAKFMLTWPHVTVATLVPTAPQPFRMKPV